MLEKKSIFDYAAHMMIIWGVSIACQCLFCILFGESAKGMSSMFSLGGEGIAIETLLQLLLLAVLITGFRWLFFTDIVFKQMTILFRAVGMLAGAVVSVGVFSALWKWFPINRFTSWVCFFGCFFVCAVISFMVSVWKEKMDNRKMQEALNRLKEELSDE